MRLNITLDWIYSLCKLSIMKLIKILTILLLLVGCASKPNIKHSEKNVISHSWITKLSSIEEIHEGNYNLCRAFPKTKHKDPNFVQEEGKSYPLEDFIFLKDECIKETGNPFSHSLKDGYKVYDYSGREGRRLETGYALVVDGVIVDVIVRMIAE